MRSHLRLLGRQRLQGQVLIWVALMLPLFLSIIGLAIDGGIAFAERRELQNDADGAARAGAMQIDQQIYRSSGGATVVLDQNAARAAAATYLVSQGSKFIATIDVQLGRIDVRLTRTMPTAFVRLVGINTMQMTAIAEARPRHGIVGQAP